MALQGNLHDFSATEILQLLGMQQKSGCLVIERQSQRVSVFVMDGRIVSTRLPGMFKDDPLLLFLLKIHRLSEEQHLGIASIQRESRRDLEDILITGRYVEADELAIYLERQILDDITRIVRWDNGSYRFEVVQRWEHPVRVRLSMEGSLIEAARRLDEYSRCSEQFTDPDVLLGVRDLPDPNEPLTEEERELFGIIDGRHTLAEVIEAAPLTESEAYESIDRMLQAQWIEFVGRRESEPQLAGPTVVLRPEPVRPTVVRHSLVSEMLLVISIVTCAAVLFAGGRAVRSTLNVRSNDVFLTAQLRDVRYALELFKRERGNYPSRLDDLATDRWVTSAQLHVPGHRLYYHLTGTAQTYDLRLERDN
jgi:hypothetical protein